MIIAELEIYKILDCKQLSLRFDCNRRSSVYVVQNNDNAQSHHLLTLAVQLLCSAKYAKSSFCTDPIFNRIREGFVRMKFIIPVVTDRYFSGATSIQIPINNGRYETDSYAGGDNIYGYNNEEGNQTTDQCQDESEEELDLRPSTSVVAQKRLHELQRRRTLHRCLLRSQSLVQKFIIINACRDFRIFPNEIMYCINDGPKERCSLPAFHGRFNICIDYMLPFLKNLSLDFNGDWLELFSSDLNDRWNRGAQLDDPFERFVFLYHKYGYPEQHILSEITRAHLSSSVAMEALQKTYVIKILRDTRGIFEFITAGESTVFFYIPHYGRYADVVLDVCIEDLSFECMRTFIQDNSKLVNQKFFWAEAHPAIKNMLLIAFQISLSFHCKQKIIYLSNFNEISDYQVTQLATSANFQKHGFVKSAWTSKNYLQRIIDVCINTGTTAIIEYPGGIPLHPVNAYLMKTYKILEADTTWSSLKIINSDKYSFDYFLECLEEGLKNYIHK